MKTLLLTGLGILLLVSNGWTKDSIWLLEYSHSFKPAEAKNVGFTRFLPVVSAVIPLPKNAFNSAQAILTVTPYKDPNNKSEGKEYTYVTFEITALLPVQSGANTSMGATLYRSDLPLIFGEEIELLHIGEQTLRVKIGKNDP